MLLVGLTGGIGAGKSTVSSLLADYGAIIIDGDQIARDLQEPGQPLLARMADRFGADIIRADGSLDRAAVAANVFGASDEAKQALGDLNAIVRPALHLEILRQIDAQANTDNIVILDFPLLGENPRDDIAAKVVVHIPVEIAIERLVTMRGMDETDARNRIASQLTHEERVTMATHLIDNSGDLESLRLAVADLWEELSQMRDG